MSSRYKGLCFSMEDDQPIVEDETPVVEVPAEVEAGAAEVTEEAGDIGDLNEAIDSTVTDLETLEEVRDVLSDSVEAGEGVSEPTAAVTEIAVESICARLGLHGKKLMPAMESFGSKNSRLAATRVAVESITETIKAVWQKLMTWIKTMWEKVKAFFVKLFDQNLRLEKAATAMKASVLALDDAYVSKEKEFDAKGIASDFVASGTLTAGKVEEVLALHGAVTASLTKAFGDAIGIFKSSDEVVKKIVESKGEKLEAIQGELQATLANGSGSVGEAFKSISGVKTTSKKNGVEEYTAGPFVGGYTIAVTSNEKNKKGEAGFVLNVDFKAGESKAEKVKNLTKEEKTKICDEVLGLCKATAAYKQDQAKVEEMAKISSKVINDVISGLGKLYGAANGTGESAVAKPLAEVRTALQATTNTAVKLAANVPSFNVRAGKAALSYVGASLKQYGAKAEPAAK